MLRNAKKLLWKPGTMLYPVPAVLVSCGEYGGVQNIITIAWTGVVCTDPAMCSVSIRPQRFSYELIRENGEFAINLTTAAMALAVDWCGVKSGRDFDKFREMKLTPLAAKFIRPPLVAESPVNLECRVKEVRELGSHHMFIAEILAVHADPAYFDAKTGFFNLAAAEPLCYCHGHYYRLGKHIGKFGFAVEKKRKKRPLGSRMRGREVER
ncbi:MAG: flavin reductase family protein [Acidobacteria bacterium]|nr:flavin reductase family protein [Acidobacteriota bacterium]MBU4405876.1 flavin reductase family protein [Acidobacteriota bacterium]MCG2811322.1 flavin reductase family protein [Candidatus Aminicenantes bacterium]